MLVTQDGPDDSGRVSVLSEADYQVLEFLLVGGRPFRGLAHTGLVGTAATLSATVHTCHSDYLRNPADLLSLYNRYANPPVGWSSQAVLCACQSAGAIGPLPPGCFGTCRTYQSTVLHDQNLVSCSDSFLSTLDIR